MVMSSFDHSFSLASSRFPFLENLLMQRLDFSVRFGKADEVKIVRVDGCSADMEMPSSQSFSIVIISDAVVFTPLVVFVVGGQKDDH